MEENYRSIDDRHRRLLNDSLATETVKGLSVQVDLNSDDASLQNKRFRNALLVSLLIGINILAIVLSLKILK